MNGAWSLRTSLPLVLGSLILVAFATLAILGAHVAPFDPLSQDILHRMRAPSMQHPMGTDELGRDILSRVFAGARTSVAVGLLSILGGGLLGSAIGILAGVVGGWTDSIVMRVVDVMMTLPSILLAIVIVAISGSSGIGTVSMAIALANAPRFARILRGEAAVLAQTEFVAAATVLGSSRLRIVLRHILPNTLQSILILSTLRVGDAILAEASLSFLGFGPQPPAVSWGSMISDGRGLLLFCPWISLFPAGATMILVLGANLLGDQIADRLDPRAQKART